MIAGLPIESWLLIAVAVGAGLVIELAFLRAQRRAAAQSPDTPRPAQAGSASARSGSARSGSARSGSADEERGS